MEQEMKIAFRNQAEKRTNAVIEKIMEGPKILFPNF